MYEITLKTKKMRVVCAAIAAACLFGGSAFGNSVGQEQTRASELQASEPDSLTLLNHAALRATEQNLRIVYLDGAQLKSQLGGGLVSDSMLDTKGSRQIVITESGSRNKELLTDLLANGNFVISVGGANIDAVKSAFSIVQDVGEFGKKMRSDAEYDANQHRVRETISDGTKSDIIINEETLSAYFYSVNGSHSFDSVEKDIQLAVASALEWAAETSMMEANANRADLTGWQVRYTRSANYSCKGGPTQMERGRLNIRTQYAREIQETSSVRDFWYVMYNSQMLPVNGNRNYSLRVVGYPAKYISSSRRQMEDTAPNSTGGSSTWGITLEGGYGAAQVDVGWSYTTPDLAVTNHSDWAAFRAEWMHNMNFGTSQTATVQVKPGAMIETWPNITLHSVSEEKHVVNFSNHTCTYEYWQ